MDFKNLRLDIDHVLSKENRAFELISDKDFKFFCELNDTGKDIYYSSFSKMLDSSSKKNPTKTAIITTEKKYTYLEYYSLIKRYCSSLKMLNNEFPSKIAIMLEKGISQAVAVIGTVYAGSSYIPLEYDLPISMIEYSFQAAEADILVTDLEMKEKLLNSNLEFKDRIFSYEEIIKNEVDSNFEPVETSSKDIFSVIFTSGSSGKAKGVKISNAGMYNCLQYFIEYHSITDNDTMLSVSNICHDMSIFEIFVPLLVGGSVIMPDKDKSNDAMHWCDLAINHNVTIWTSVPTIFSMLLYAFESNYRKQFFNSLKTVMLAGEVIPTVLYKRLNEIAPLAKLFASGGPTETTLLNIIHPVSEDDVENGIIPYGVPIWNTQYLILNEELKVLPIGEVGTIYNCGTCLAEGYLDESLTKETFIVHPDLHIRMYNTGDLGKYNEQGFIDILGRADNQVKINGKRIELEEIEKSIEQNKNVMKSIVSVYEDQELGKKLVAQVMLNDNFNDSSNNIEHWKTVFDETYSEERNKNESESDYSGWHSTYTGKQIPIPEMQEWTKNTVSNIADICGDNVLEIGCGTGLLMYRLAKKTKSYVGLDISDEAINTLRHDLKNKRVEFDNVEVFQSSADDLSCVAGRKFNTIIINSVIMFFPSADYLIDVIKNCMELLDDGGTLFLGDIQDFDLMKVFRSSVFLFRSKDGEIGELKNVINEDCNKLKDLYVSQRFFENLHNIIPEVARTTIMQKNMTCVNEISKFRYDVVLSKNNIVSKNIINEYKFTSLEALDKDIDSYDLNNGNVIVIKDIINEMIYEDYYISNELVKCDESESIQEFKKRLMNEFKRGFYPHEFYSLAKRHQLRCVVKNTKLGMFNVYFSKGDINNISNEFEENCGKFTNEIVNEDVSEGIIEGLKESLYKLLPKYMIPDIWKVVRDIPKLNNGKIDRKKAIINVNSIINKEDFEVTNIDGSLSLIDEIKNIWQRVLKVKEIQESNSFFKIGGHSLLAMRLLSQINKKYHTLIRFSEFYKNPTLLDMKRMVEEEREENINDEVEITISKEEDRYLKFPTAGLQRSYLMGRQSNVPLGNCATHLYLELEIKNPDIKRINDVITFMIKKHDAFRTVFTDEYDQYILNEVEEINIEIDDFSKYSDEDRELYLISKRNKISEALLDYKKAPLAVFSLSRIDNTSYIFHIYLDGLIIDGWSCHMFLAEFDDLYTSDKELIDLNMGNQRSEISFRDYVLYLEKLRDTKKYLRAKDFWMSKIPSLSGNPELPMIMNPDEVISISNIKISRNCSKERLELLKNNANKVGVSVFDVMLTAFAHTVALYSKTQNFLINIPYTYRPDIAKNIEYMLGECANFFLYDFNRNKDESIKDTLKRVHNEIIDLQDNISFPGEEIVRERIKRSKSYEGQISTVVFTSLLDIPYKKLESFRQKYIDTHTSQIWIDAVVFRGDNDDCIFSWDCVKGLFDEKLLNNMFDTFMCLINGFIDSIDSWNVLKRPNLLESDLAIIDNIKPDIDVNVDELVTVSDMIINQFEKRKNDLAIITMDNDYTYNDLKRRTISIATELSKYINIENNRVAILLGKSFNQIASILSVTLNSGCYVPVEHSYPLKKVIEILKICNVKAILTDNENYNSALQVATGIGNIEVINVDSIKDISNIDFKFNSKIKEDSDICIIHSSGTTGTPKGMVVKQIGLSNVLMYTKIKWKIDENDSVVGNTNYCHDISLFQIFVPLICGGKIALPLEKYWMDPNYIAKLMYKASATIWFTVPVMMEMLIDSRGDILSKAMKKLRLVMLGGECMNMSTPNKIWKFSKDIEVYNVGGPSEATNLNIVHKVVQNDIEKGIIPYGKPIANSEYMILNEWHEQCPIGVEGRLFIGGIGLVDGYIGLPDLTEKKFIKNICGREVLYDTGDLGKYDRNGEIIFLGRNNNQIKLNGKRIELDGIESVITAYEGIDSVIVKLGKNKQLMAYYVSENEIDQSLLIEHLEENLPKYQIPYLYKRIDSIPVTQNGKKDRKVLEDIEFEGKYDNQPIVNDEISEEIKAICCKILKLDNIELDSNYIYIGGNSVHAIQVLSEIRSRFGVMLELYDLFNNPVISVWCDLVRKAIKAKDQNNSSIVLADVSEKKENYLLSYSQEGILFRILMDNDTEKFIVGVSEIKGEINIEAIKYAFKNILINNNILRSRITETKDGEFIQSNVAIDEEVIEIIPFDNITDEVVKEYSSIIGEKKLMNLDEKYYKFQLLYSKSKSFLILGIHHIISDDETFGILMDELVMYYDDYCNGVVNSIGKDLQYEDYVNWQRGVYEEKLKKSDIYYWINKLQSLKEGTPNESIAKCTDIGVAGKYYDINLSREDIEKVKVICGTNNISIYSCYTIIYAISVMTIIEEKEIWMGMPISNRRNMANSNVCGLFVNIVPIMINIRNGESFLTAMKRIFKEVLEVTKHSTLPFEYIVRKLGLPNEYSQLPFNILINYLGATGKSRKIDDITFGDTDFVKNEVFHNLGLLIDEKDDGNYKISVSANENLFSEEIMDVFCDTYSYLVKEFVSNPEYIIDGYLFD
ncbi:AMP-binding protein [Clostridium sp. LP20]|uniref:AMP-binding protein n=1 Tax=Clostridium sp. LP20 TaxID=3418665 RepID=UPI003EE52F1A